MTKEDLKRYIRLREEMEQVQEKITNLREDLMSPSGKVITWTPAAPKQGDKFADVAAKMDELERRYEDMLLERIHLCAAIENAIEKVDDDRMRILLRSRYIQGKTWEQICVQLNYSWRQIHYLHSKALKKIEDCKL